MPQPPQRPYGDVTLSKELKEKQAFLNLEGVLKEECFKYSVLWAIYRDRFCRQKQALSRKYTHFLHNINFTKISSPTHTKDDIDKFEHQNEKHVVAVFQWEEEGNKKKLTVTLIREPNRKTASGKTILMLLVKGDDSRYHYLPITNLDRLLNSNASYHERI